MTFPDTSKLSVFLTMFFISASFCCTAQSGIIVKYDDSNWNSVSKDSAYFMTEIVREDTFYRYTSYWMKSRKVSRIATYTDTAFKKRFGKLLRYYETGITEDSIYFNSDGSYKIAYHYYPDGKLWAHYTWDPVTKNETTEGFDKNGVKLEDFVFFKEASFRSGASDWMSYIIETIKPNLPSKKGAPAGKYQVIIKFVVGKDGNVKDILAETNYGYGMEQEAIRIIRKSPKWTPAIYLGNPVNAYRRQPVTFVVE